MMTSPTGKFKSPLHKWERDRVRVSGFTMTEILVVIIIIAIIAAASTPVFLKITRQEKLKSGAKYIASSLKSARSYAIVRRMGYAVNLYLGDVDSTGTVIKKAVEIYETPDFKKFIYMPAGIRISDGSTYNGIIEYTFTSTGQASINPSNTVVRVEDLDGKYFDISVFGLTGQVKISDLVEP